MSLANPPVVGELNETAKNHFEWKIPKLSTLHLPSYEYLFAGVKVRSPSYSFENKSMHLSSYPKLGVMNSVFLNLEDINTFPVDVNVSFSVKHSDGMLIGTQAAILKHKCDGCYTEFVDVKLKRKAFRLLLEGTLIIGCDLKIDLGEKQTIPIVEEANCQEKSAATAKEHQDTHKRSSNIIKEHMKLIETDLLCKNLKDLLTNKDSCDTVVIVQGKEYKVHKSILIARSPVFAAMFQHDTTEKQTGKVIIPDCDPDSFQAFLEYVYSGRLEDISSDSALHLYYTSDKYNMQELKAFCVKYLMHNLTLENVCDVVSFADKYDETRLLSAAQDFFNKNLEEILTSREWQDLFKNNFRLANRLLVEMSKAKK